MSTELWSTGLYTRTERIKRYRRIRVGHYTVTIISCGHWVPFLSGGILLSLTRYQVKAGMEVERRCLAGERSYPVNHEDWHPAMKSTKEG
ncbi:hypothetical protein L1987_45592 [Smallanthus sonchifolius]|uniref:Uncharacterized protein n=1 Tax=Smallanthus sonchifolius TaxID=185202 RepID=A0ACB9FXA5_9ASTR|nr:hypothetical protein L1987_45592 [Smallanthus sonchifolius]